MFKLVSVSALEKRLARRQWLKPFRRWLWGVLMLAGLWMALAAGAQGIEAVPIDVPTEPVGGQVPESVVVPQVNAQISGAEPAEAQAAKEPWKQDIANGIDAFEQGRLAEAIARWQRALSAVESLARNPKNGLTKAYLLSNLAAAYQQTGQLTAAQATIAESLDSVEAYGVEAWPAESQTYWEVAARVANTQGQILYQVGQTQQALESWTLAESRYRKAQQPLGQLRSQLNQAIVQQELGFNVRAVRQLNQLSQTLTEQPYPLQLSFAKELGSALRRVGELSRAEDIFSVGLQLAGTENDLAIQQLTLERGHTLRVLSHQAIAVGKTQAAKTYRERALADYVAVGSAAAAPESRLDKAALRVQAQLNQLSYLIETGQLEAASAVWPQIELSTLSSGRARTEAYISYAHSLNCLRSPLSVTCIKKEWQAALGEADAVEARGTAPEWALIAETLATAVRQAEALSDSLLVSYATGELGHAYELAGQTREAVVLTQRALSELEGTQSPEVAYRWEWQLGRLYHSRLSDSKPSTESELAMESYQQALTSLDAVRRNLLLIDSQAQFSFRDDVEPLYREFATLLLSTPFTETAETAETAQIDARERGDTASTRLALAVKTLDALQITELENFLGCNLSQLINLTEESGETRTDPTAAKLYPILLPSQLAVIVDIPGQPLALRTTAVLQSDVEETLTALRNNLTLPGKTPEVLTFSQQLYQWLIEPVVPILAENEQIKTLVFVLDGPLRNVPMGVLYDGEQYLIEKDYAIAIAPQLALFAPRPTPSQLKVLRGGVSLPQTVRGRRFPSIELVQAELDKIPPELTVAPPLINEAFTQTNIEQQLTGEQYNAIHWKTHGVFSADPMETFLVAYEERITANDLSTLVQSARTQQAQPLELLVLSACETAQGDRRAVLGLAGIAVRAGTRSTLSTLWRADDGANTQLMDDFYQGLQEGLTKAQALQRSQQRLLSEGGYPAPYYWAPYVLVGNWL
ncbi:MAG: CHAT domain-containing protein [Cyanobacteria bacterium J06649_5]